MMNLGFVSAIVPELSFEEVVSFAAANGFACVELMCWPKGKADRKYAGVTHIDAGELDAGSAARIGIDWGRFVSALTDVRYEGPACIEVEDRAFEADLDSRKAAIVQSQRYLRQFIIG
jgi:sugar phosphate isomerase/epimerase